MTISVLQKQLETLKDVAASLHIALKHERKCRESTEAHARKSSRLAVEAIMKNESDTLSSQAAVSTQQDSIIASLKVRMHVFMDATAFILYYILLRKVFSG
jgi:phosphoenolpyruvate synthase/pyruvate phosphate dikinase